jgi:hypothetical protein
LYGFDEHTINTIQAHIRYWASDINQQFLARLEVFIAVIVRIVVFCNMILCGWIIFLTMLTLTVYLLKLLFNTKH